MGKIKKVIFFVEAKFNMRDYRRFEIDLFRDNGFVVEVWDFSYFIAPSKYNTLQLHNPISWEGAISFYDREKAVEAILSLDKSCVVMNVVRCNRNTFSIYRALSKKNIFYFVLSTAIPISTRLRKRMVKRLGEFDVKRLARWAMNNIPAGLLGIKSADVVLAPGRKYDSAGLPVGRKSEVLWTHSFDYDVYLENRNKPYEPLPKMVVFLDEFLPYHPDNAFLSIEQPVTSEEYYPLLCGLFGSLEKRYGIHVVIAAHPRSDYDKRPDHFGGRKVIRGRTMELVRQSDFVLMHHSCAINYAVLFRKPIIFITTDKIIEGFEKETIEEPPVTWLASLFYKKAHNLNDPLEIDLKQELVVDEMAYKYFRDAYIKREGTEEKPYWQIVIDRIKRMDVEINHA